MQDSVVFFGTGPVAARSLELLSQDFVIEAVITKPRPEHHKGEYPVLKVAQQLGLPILPATNKRELDALMETQPVRSRLGILVDFGIIVSQTVIDYFPLGIVNSHFSLLPEWRGADPITFSILSGQHETGVSLMMLVEKMDEGPLLAQAPYSLPPDITTPQLTEELVNLSASLLKQIVPLYFAGKAQPAPQENVALPGHEVPSYSRKLSKEDGLLDFTKPAEQLEREIRAFSDWPKSHATVADKDIIVTQGHVINGAAEPGTLWKNETSFGFYTTSGILVIDRLKPAGKNEMSASAFLAGHRLI